MAVSMSSSSLNSQFNSMLEEEDKFKKELKSKQKLAKTERETKDVLSKAALALKTGGVGAEKKPGAAFALFSAMALMMQDNTSIMSQKAQEMQNTVPQMEALTTQLNGIKNSQSSFDDLDSQDAMELEQTLNAKMTLINNQLSTLGIDEQGKAQNIQNLSGSDTTMTGEAKFVIDNILSQFVPGSTKATGI